MAFFQFAFFDGDEYVGVDFGGVVLGAAAVVVSFAAVDDGLECFSNLAFVDLAGDFFLDGHDFVESALFDFFGDVVFVVELGVGAFFF